MARVFCVPWSEDDEALGVREVGWSLHLTRADAAAYVKEHAARYDGHGRAYCVDVPEDVHEEVRRTRNGLLWVTPCGCPFPRAPEPALAFAPATERRTELPSARGAR